MTGVPRPQLRRETALGLEVAGAALELALSGVGADDITSKGGRDLVTAVDTAVEDLVRERLTEGFGFPVIGEERGGTAPNDGSAYWLVDPICGTRNLASGTPLYSVNLALIEDGVVTASVAGDPSTGDIAIAERDGGAWALADGAWRALRTDASNHLVTGEDAKATGLRRDHAAAFIERLIREDRWDYRALGTTLTSIYVASGRFAGYVVFLVPALHAAAGTLLVTEAGGVISDVYGEPWSLESDTLIAAADRELHAALLEISVATRPADPR